MRIEPETEDELRFGEAIDALMRQLSLLVVADGEGARRVGRVVVHGGEPERRGPRRPRGGQLPAGQDGAVRGRSELGADHPGRRGGDAGHRAAGRRHRDRGGQVCAGGGQVPHDADALAAAVTRDEVEYEIGLPGDGAETEVYFSDLGHEYVTINADYTT